MSHNSTNYKIKKYQYKLDHAKNKKEAASYKAKLDSYKTKQAGGVEPEEIRDMINKAFTGSEEQVSNLAAQFDTLIEEIRKKCCEKKDCGPETLAQIAKLEEDWRSILKTELGKKDIDMSKKLTEQRELLEKKLKIDCPPEQSTLHIAEPAKLPLETTAPLQVEPGNEQLLLTANQQESEAIPPIPEIAQAPLESPETKRMAELQKAAKESAEAVAKMTENPLLGGKRRKRTTKK